MSEWYYADGKGGQVGPITLDQLAGVLAGNRNGGEVLVWRPGLADWTRAFEVSEIASRLPPPPLPIQRAINRQPKEPTEFGCAPIGFTLLGIFTLLVVIGALSSREKSTNDKKNPAVVNCENDYSLCANNAEMVNKYSKMFDARFGCKRAVERAARFGTPDFNTYYFGSFRSGVDYPAFGKVTLIDNDVKIRNQYNTPTRTRVVCTYDFKSGTATIDSTN